MDELCRQLKISWFEFCYIWAGIHRFHLHHFRHCRILSLNHRRPLTKAISFAKQFTIVLEQDNKIIMHARKSLLFDKKTPWTKKDDKGTFDVTMGSYDGAEVCELVGTYILNVLAERYGKNNVGLYSDDGLAVFENINGNQAEKIRKEIMKIFPNLRLKITIEANQRIANFVDITLHLTNGKY